MNTLLVDACSWRIAHDRLEKSYWISANGHFSAKMHYMLGTIGLFLRTTDNDYQQRLNEVGRREAKRQGFDVAVESAQNDAGRQVTQIQTAIRNASITKLAAILVSGVRDEILPPLVREAAQAGIDWALLHEGTYIDEIRQEYPGRAIFAVTPDQAEIGRIHGRQVRALVGKAGKVLCVTGPLTAVSAQRRLDGLKEVLVDGYDLFELNADWTSEGARMAVDRWVSELSSDAGLPDMFVAHNDEMALGVRQSLRDATSSRDLPLGAAFITGCDGSQTFGQRLVREGRLKATVIMPPASGAAIEWIARARTRGEIPPVRVVQPVTSFPSLSSLKR
jgi:ABC-type sugar transport system substrate-binding protein